MKQIVTAVLVIFAIAACIKSPESNDELSSASDPVLISHMDSICFFHNRVMDNIKLMTRSGELSVNPPIHIFVDRVSDCTEDVLLSNDINYRVTTDQKNKMTESVSPFIFGLLDSNNDSMKQINNIIDSSFSKSCAQCLKQLIETDFLIQPDISMISDDIDKEIIEAFYSIGVTSKDYWKKIEPSGKINKTAYCADSLGGALSILFSFSGPSAWFMLAVSNAWSAAVDNYHPTEPVEWTNCD